MSRREQAVADAESCEDANIPSPKFDIGLIAFYESSDRIEELKKCENVKKAEKS